jgi:hypothetical protein
MNYTELLWDTHEKHGMRSTSSWPLPHATKEMAQYRWWRKYSKNSNGVKCKSFAQKSYHLQNNIKVEGRTKKERVKVEKIGLAFIWLKQDKNRSRMIIRYGPITFYRKGAIILTNKVCFRYYMKWCRWFIGAFAKLRKVPTSFVMSFRPPVCLSVCLSVRIEQLHSHQTEFHKIWYLSIFRKSVAKIQVSLKSDKNNVYFT